MSDSPVQPARPRHSRSVYVIARSSESSKLRIGFVRRNLPPSWSLGSFGAISTTSSSVDSFSRSLRSPTDAVALAVLSMASCDGRWVRFAKWCRRHKWLLQRAFELLVMSQSPPYTMPNGTSPSLHSPRDFACHLE